MDDSTIGAEDTSCAVVICTFGTFVITTTEGSKVFTLTVGSVRACGGVLCADAAGSTVSFHFRTDRSLGQVPTEGFSARKRRPTSRTTVRHACNKVQEM